MGGRGFPPSAANGMRGRERPSWRGVRVVVSLWVPLRASQKDEFGNFKVNLGSNSFWGASCLILASGVSLGGERPCGPPLGEPVSARLLEAVGVREWEPYRLLYGTYITYSTYRKVFDKKKRTSTCGNDGTSKV